METNEISLLFAPEQALIDVTDKSLYSFAERKCMTRFLEASTVMALNKFFALADSDNANYVVYAAQKIPYLKSYFDLLKGKTELVVKLSE